MKNSDITRLLPSKLKSLKFWVKNIIKMEERSQLSFIDYSSNILQSTAFHWKITQFQPQTRTINPPQTEHSFSLSPHPLPSHPESQQKLDIQIIWTSLESYRSNCYEIFDKKREPY